MTIFNCIVSGVFAAFFAFLWLAIDMRVGQGLWLGLGVLIMFSLAVLSFFVNLPFPK